MTDFHQKIKKLKEEIRKTPYHKGTEHYIGKLRARISKLEDKIYHESKKGAGGGGIGFAVAKSGDATAVLIGPPSVGKSTLLNSLTSARSKVAPYEFTTTKVIPGMMEYKDAKIQILDLPGILKKASVGRGRGREIISAARGADCLLLMIDVLTFRQIPQIVSELESTGIRVNKKPPKINVKKTNSGGLKVIQAFKNGQIDDNLVKEIANEYKVVNAEIFIKERVNVSDLIDSFSANRIFLPCLYLINKIDLADEFDFKNMDLKEFINDIILISAEKNINIGVVKEAIWEKLGLIRVYTKKKDKNAKAYPVILKRGDTVYLLAKMVSQDLIENTTGAFISKKGTQNVKKRVGRNYLLESGDIVTLY